ncbi:MAG TPA: hypothetical protein VKD90_23845 [Gemmataceae bacterium]|nr:hypothetical protein [Gemmataceae bacterium]
MRTLSALTLVAAGLAAGPAVADDKDSKKELSGSYTRKADQMDLKLVFKKDNMMEFHVAIGDAGCVLTAKYTRDKDGTVTAEVTDFEKKGDFPVVKEKGYRFSFKWEPGDKKGKLSELKGDDIQDEQRQAVEGEYEAKSD